MKTNAIMLAPLAAALLIAGQVSAQDHAHHPAPAAQEDHSQHHAPAKSKAKAKKPAPKPQPEPSEHDHAAMGHETPPPEQAQPEAEAEHDHAAMGHETPPEEAAPEHDHAAMDHDAPAPTEPLTPIPVLTDADRAAAAGPSGHGHAMHDDMVHRFVQFDRLEGFETHGSRGLEWEVEGWVGTDLHKLWVRSEGERVGGNTEDADLEILYGRAIAPWWDLVAGVRHHFEPGDSQDQAVLGVMGLSPYKFEVNASLYVGGSGYTGARLEAEYETLLTNRLILQPAIEVNFHGKDDPAHGNGSGLGTVEAGLRLRYEFTRRFAPYVGLVHERAYGRTADFRREDGEDVDDTRVVFGVRLWF